MITNMCYNDILLLHIIFSFDQFKDYDASGKSDVMLWTYIPKNEAWLNHMMDKNEAITIPYYNTICNGRRLPCVLLLADFTISFSMWRKNLFKHRITNHAWLKIDYVYMKLIVY